MRNRSNLFLALAVCACALLGQALTSLTGSVSDPSGAVIPGAAITITNDATHATRQATADSGGRYSFLQVEPGTYTVTAKAPGFAQVSMPNVELLVNTPASLPIRFQQVGTVNETVQVSAEATQVNTTDASLGNAVSGNVITQVPLEGRNVVGLLALQPGVVFLGEPDPGTN